MPDRPPDRAAAKPWRKFLGGLTAAMLLLPVPAFAFTWVENTWTASAVTNASWSFSDNNTGTGDSFLNIFPTTLSTTSPNVSASITLTRTLVLNGTQAITVFNTNSGTLGANTTFNTSLSSAPGGTLINYSLTGPGTLANNQFGPTTPAAGNYGITVTFNLNSPAAGAGWTVSSPTSIYEVK